MSLAGAGQLRQRLPLSPQSPQQSHGFTASTYVSRQSLPPTSPPLSSSTSIHGSESASPQHVLFSPPLSVAMSAQTSQTSLNSNTSYRNGESGQHPLHSKNEIIPKSVAQDTPSPGWTGSAKRKFEDDESSATATSSKRGRVEDIAEGTLSPASTGSAKRKFEEDDPNTAMLSNKRSRDDAWQTMESTMHMDAAAVSKLKAQTLGPLYKVCQQPHPLSRPHASQDLISLFRLDDMAASVARRDANTGEKINKLRKSYENQIKDLPGKNKPTTSGGSFLELLNWPDEEWQVQRVGDRDVTQGLGDDMMKRLELAARMESTKLPATEQAKWKGIISLEETPVKVEPSVRPINAQPAYAMNVSNPVSAEPPRATRRGVKRRYDDESFEGYGEGFVDDSVANNIADDQEDITPGAGMKRKKRRDGAGSPRYATFNPSITVGNGSYSTR